MDSFLNVPPSYPCMLAFLQPDGFFNRVPFPLLGLPLVNLPNLNVVCFITTLVRALAPISLPLYLLYPANSPEVL